MRIPIHREGWRYIAVAAAVNAALFAAWLWAGVIFLPVTLWCIAFFRDPERVPPRGAGLIVSPADGKLLPLAEAAPPRELGMGETPRLRLSIFMDVFNVHVNRMPVDGRVVALSYRPGRFINASFDKASEHNERMSIRVEPAETQDGGGLAVIQIAGLVAPVTAMLAGMEITGGPRMARRPASRGKPMARAIRTTARAMEIRARATAMAVSRGKPTARAIRTTARAMETRARATAMAVSRGKPTARAMEIRARVTAMEMRGRTETGRAIRTITRATATMMRRPRAMATPVRLSIMAVR